MLFELFLALTSLPIEVRSVILGLVGLLAMTGIMAISDRFDPTYTTELAKLSFIGSGLFSLASGIAGITITATVASGHLIAPLSSFHLFLGGLLVGFFADKWTLEDRWITWGNISSPGCLYLSIKAFIWLLATTMMVVGVVWLVSWVVVTFPTE